MKKNHRALAVLALPLLVLVGVLAFGTCSYDAVERAGESRDATMPATAKAYATVSDANADAIYGGAARQAVVEEGGVVAEGDDSSGVRLNRPVLVEGCVLFEGGAPVEGKALRVRLHGSAGREAVQTTTTAGGEWSVLSRQSYAVGEQILLTVEGDGFDGPWVSPYEGRLLHHASDNHAYLLLVAAQRSITLRGTITLSEDVRPEGTLFVAPRGAKGVVIPPPAGDFEVESPIWGGRVRLEYGISSGSSRAVRRATLSPAREQIADGTMEGVFLTVEGGGCAIQLKVVDEAGDAVAGATVLVQETGQVWETDVRGSAEIRVNCETESSVVVESTPRHRVHRQLIDPGTRQLVVTLGTANRVEGKVVDASGRGLSGVRIKISSNPAQLGDVAFVAADARGAFEFYNTAQGTPLWLVVSRGEQVVAERVVSPRWEGDYLEVIASEELGSISGVVLLPNGEPASLASVAAIRRDRGEASAEAVFSDRDGRFSLALPDAGGQYEVSAQKSGFARARGLWREGEEVVLVLAELGVVRCRLASSRDDSAHMVTVTVLKETEDGERRIVGSPQVFITHDGYFERTVPALRIGDACVLQVESEEWGEKMVEVVVRSKEDVDVVEIDWR